MRYLLCTFLMLFGSISAASSKLELMDLHRFNTSLEPAQSLDVGCNALGTLLPKEDETAVKMTARWERNDGMILTLWRTECRNEVQLMLRVEPFLGNKLPFVCSSSFTVFQNNLTYHSLKIDHCATLTAPTTFVVKQWSFEKQFDPLKEFTLIFSGVFDDFRMTLPEYTPPTNNEPTDNLVFGPEFTGSWYDPSRSGEGFIFELTDDGIFVVYMYTFSPDKSGEQYWLVGTEPYGKATSLSIDLRRPIGGALNSTLNPSIVSNASISASMVLSFQSCTTGKIKFRYYDGVYLKESILSIQRITSPSTFGCTE